MFRPRPLFPVLLALVMALGVGCSQQKDAFLNRTFHRLTARDNGWFNAQEKLQEVVQGMEDNYLDDFDEVLPLFVLGTPEQVKAITPELETCIEKCSLVIERHSMDIGGEEKNTWIDDAWLVIGRSQYYKGNYYEADRIFGFVGRRYKGWDRQAESYVWQARAAIQMEQYAKAQSALDKVRSEKKLPKRFDHGQFYAVQADLDLKRGKLDDAIMNLELAIPNARTKRERVRWSFVLAQLYAKRGTEDKAIQQYAAVARMNPPYEMAFHARIFQAFAFNRGDSKALRQRLERMLRDEKHVDHFDMIHYALADLDLKENNKEGAIHQLETSARVSTTDTKQKAKTWLRLADLYFDDREYANAQVYYDSTRTLLNEENLRYDEVVTRADVLGSLVEQLRIIALEDSLQALAQLDEEELAKRVRIMIRERERAEEERERREAEAREQVMNTPGDKQPAGRPAGGSGAWYFYDPNQIARGMAQFRKVWGVRPLEDNWRRKDRSGSTLPDAAAEEDLVEEMTPKGQEPWRDPAYYTKDLPRDEMAIAESNARICSALYLSGMIYKEQLRDPDNAVESFEMLVDRFDDCRYTPESFYQLYRIYLEKEQAANYFSPDGSGSQQFANIVLTRWPDSEFARLILNPNVHQADEARRIAEEEAYRELYQQYRQFAYGHVITTSSRVIDQEPNNHFLVKYHLLRAMAIGGSGDSNGFREALLRITQLFPGTEEAEAAQRILDTLNKDQAAIPPKSAGGKGNYKPSTGRHHFAVIVPNKGHDMDKIKANLANMNVTYFRQPGLEFTSSFLDPQNQVVLVSFFDTKAKAMQFYELYKGDVDMLDGLNNLGLPAFVISTENYTELYKNRDVEGYSAFFSANYLNGK